MIHLDHNASTQPSPGVVDAMTDALTRLWANPSSVHRAGQETRRAVELARKEVAELLGAKPRDVVFASGGTESGTLAIRGILGNTDRRVVVTSAIEHTAIRQLTSELARDGRIELRVAPVNADGVVDTDALAGMIDDSVALVSVMWTNSETGAVQPVEAVGALCRDAGVPFHCDATQWVGKMPVDVASSPIDLLTCSAHKFHGPKGVGALWIRPRSWKLRGQQHGPQELGRRGGTENVPGIIGMGLAAREAREWIADPAHADTQRALRDRLEREILERCAVARVNSAGAERLWNTANIAFPGLESEAIVLTLSERGVACSAGSACSSGSMEPSATLAAMGLPEPVARGSVRFSLSRHTTPDEIDRAAPLVAECVGSLRASTPITA